MNVAAYIRVSTDAQAGPDAFGLDAQRSSITSYAERMGYGVVAWYEDAGISGSTMNRPALQSLLSDAKDHKFDGVVFAKLDRLSRSLLNTLQILNALVAVKVWIMSVAENFDTSTPSGMMYFQLLGMFAENERRVITDRLSGGRKAKALQGGYCGGRAALGYTAVRGGKVLTVDDTKANVVREVFALRAQGRSLRSVASELNSLGVATHEGKSWHSVQVKRVLDRAALYRGQYSYGGVKAERGKQERILI